MCDVFACGALHSRTQKICVHSVLPYRRSLLLPWPQPRMPHCLQGMCGTVVAGVPREPHGEARSRRAAVDCDCAHDHRATHELMLQAAVLNSLRTAGSRTMLSSLGSMGHGRRQRKKRKRSCHSLLVHEWARMPHARERQARDRLPSAVRGALRDLPLWLCVCLIWQPVWVMLWTRIDTLGVVRQCARVSCASWGGRCVVGARLRAISMIVIFFFAKRCWEPVKNMQVGSDWAAIRAGYEDQYNQMGLLLQTCT